MKGVGFTLTVTHGLAGTHRCSGLARVNSSGTISEATQQRACHRKGGPLAHSEVFARSPPGCFVVGPCIGLLCIDVAF